MPRISGDPANFMSSENLDTSAAVLVLGDPSPANAVAQRPPEPSTKASPASKQGRPEASAPAGGGAPDLQKFSTEVGWQRQVALFGPGASAWLEEFRERGCAGPSADAYEAVLALRHHRIEQAAELLDRTWCWLLEADRIPVSMLQVVRRWYFTSAAYLDYLEDDFDRAEHRLAAASRAVGAAIQRRPFLLPLAMHCIDFFQQGVRISRQRRRWDEMVRRLERLRGVYAGDLPLCRLEGGRALSLGTLANVFAELPTEAEDDPFLEFLGSRELRLRSFDTIALKLGLDPRLVLSF